MARWLTGEGGSVWRALVEVDASIRTLLDEELTEICGLTLGEYGVLVRLSEASDHRLRMSDLAEMMHLSPSGLTRRFDRLVRLGIVVREASTEDRRVTMAVLTQAGTDLIASTAHQHMDGVRRHFLNHLSAEDVQTLGRILTTLIRNRNLADL